MYMVSHCICFTNCVGSLGLVRLFEKHPDFKRVSYFSNFDEGVVIPDEALELCDLFIYQSTTKGVDMYTSKLKSSCTIVSFPYLYCDGLFTIHHGTGGFAPIERLLESGKTLDEVLQMFDEGTIDFNLDERRKKSLEILKKKEEQCTVKISDFIEQNQDKVLFFTHNHPTYPVVLELCNRILAHIGLMQFKLKAEPGWLNKSHLDTTGFCSHPIDKEMSTNERSILNLDRYSAHNQVRCYHGETNLYEYFYIESDDMTRQEILKKFSH